MHLVGDGAVARMPLAAGAQLDQLHRLAGVEVEDEADPVAEAQRVRRGVWRPRPSAAARTRRLRDLERAAVLVAAAGELDLLGNAGAEVGRQRLPLDRQHPVALQVAERAVVGDDLEAVAQRLEPAPGAVAAVGRASRPDRRAAAPRSSASSDATASRIALLARTRSTRTAAPRAGRPRRRRRARSPTDGPSASASVDGSSRPSRSAHRSPAPRPGLQVGDPLAAALGPLDARDEARHHGLDLVEDHPRRTRGPRAGDAPAGAGSAARRSGRVAKIPMCESELAGSSPRSRSSALALIARAWAAGGLALGRAGTRSPPRRRPGAARPSRSRTARPSPPCTAGRARGRGSSDKPGRAGPAPGHRGVVGDVAGRLLQVGAEARALEDLGEHVRDPLAGDVGAAELGDRVVAVAEEDPLVQLRRPLALVAVAIRPACRRRRRRTRRGTAGAACPGSASSGRTARP